MLSKHQSPRVLVVDDDETLRLTLRGFLLRHGYLVDEATNGMQAVQCIEGGATYAAVILDVNMPEMSGLDALARIKEVSPGTFCVIATAYTNIKDAVTAIKNGAYDYIEKPIDEERLLKVLRSASEAGCLVEAAALSAPQLSFDEQRSMIGESLSLKKVFGVIYKLSKVDTSVLIRGESGTGKELVARALHFNSQRKKGPFVAINCGAIPENLVESELFGFEKGAFTGADKRKLGKFQFAEGGTLFLDEIGDLSATMQVKLLRVIQERLITPVGSNQESPVDVRLIAATNRPLEKMMETGAFRADLYYRLNILPIQLPPLRDRLDDIPPLVDYMIEKFNRIHNRSITGISSAALAALQQYNWPGNIRELENVIERAFILEGSSVIQGDALPENIAGSVVQLADESETDAKPVISGDDKLNYPLLKERFEKDFIVTALKTYKGRINQTAEHTQMTKVTLLRKLEKYGIDPKEFY